MNKIKFLKQFVLLFSLTILVSCLGEKNKISEEKKEKLISIFNSEDNISVMHDSPDIIIGNNYKNSLWTNSKSAHYFARGNISLTHNGKKELAIRGFGSNIDNKINQHVSPLIVDKIIYVMDGKGKVHAFYAEEPYNIIWTKRLLSLNHHLYAGGMTYYNDMIFVTLGENKIYALNAKTGDIIWEKEILHLLRAAPNADDKTVIAKSIDGIVYAFDSETGDLLWNHYANSTQTTLFGSSAPLISNGKVIITHDSGEVYIITLDTGKEIFNDTIFNNNNLKINFTDIDTTPILSENNLFIFSHSGKVVSYDFANLYKKWEKDLHITSQPWLSGNYIYMIDDNKNLVAMNKDNGSLKWVIDISSYLQSEKDVFNGPLVINNNLLITTSTGFSLLFSPFDGHFIEKNHIIKNSYTIPAAALDKLFIINNDSKLAIYE